MKNLHKFTIYQISFAALVAALYAALTLLLAPISFGPIQFRVSEALTLLPYCIPQSVPGLFVGCLVANVVGGFGIIDIVLGSLATLAAAWLTSKAPNVWIAALPPVILNALVVGTYVAIISSIPIAPTMLYIGLSETVICYALGVPLVLLIKRKDLVERFVK